MADTDNLKNGTGKPYLAIFDSSEAPILDLVSNVPIGVFVTSFTYKYVEDGVDEAEVIIQTPNQNIADHPNLQYLMPIKLQWGWIYSDGTSKSGPVRSVVVKDYTLGFNEEGVKFTLKLADSSFLLKKEPANYSEGTNKNEDSFNQYLEQLVTGTFELEIIDFSLQK